MSKISAQNWDGTTTDLSSTQPLSPSQNVVITTPTAGAQSVAKKGGVGKVAIILLILLAVGIGAYFLFNGGSGDIMKKASPEQVTKISTNAGAMVQGFLRGNTETVTNSCKEFANVLNGMGIKAKDFTTAQLDQMLNSMDDNVKKSIIEDIAVKARCTASEITLTVRDGVIIPVINGVENMACKIDLPNVFEGVKAQLTALQNK